MKTFVWFMLLLFLAVTTKAGELENDSTLNLMPLPAKIELGHGQFSIDSSFAAQIKGAGTLRLEKAVGRFFKRLGGKTGLDFPQVYYQTTAVPAQISLQISIQRQAELELGANEDYALHVSPGLIKLDAQTDLGAMHGLETLLQLLAADSSGYYFPEAKIEDTPRFPWRGLLIDACRHFMPVEVIKRNLDGMALVKLNVLHWHLSEDQGFRVECKTFPKLHQLGSDGDYYTQNQIKDIIDYASDRGIRVVPEFDLPGHATSWLVGYPELASAPGPYQIERGFGVFDPTINPTQESTYQFLDAFFKEMSALFPDAYMHIGGDENKGVQWDANADIQAFMRANNLKDNHALQAYFNRRLLNILTKYGKKMMGWDEILHTDLPKNIVIQSWRGREAMVNAARRGYATLLSNGYYIDLVQPASFHYRNDPAPADLPLTSAERKMILGGEATMWAELVSPETVDSRIWPRTAAIAERLWSPGSVNNVNDMYRRLDAVSACLEDAGLQHKRNYEVLLRRLTGNRDTTPLRILVDVLEPVKKYQRHRLRKHFAYTPLTKVVDAARPESRKAREFLQLVQSYRAAKDRERDALAAQLKHQLTIWRQNNGPLNQLIKVAPRLKSIAGHAQNLKRVAEAGLAALEGKKQSDILKDEWGPVLEQASGQQAMCELAVVPAIRLLLETP